MRRLIFTCIIAPAVALLSSYPAAYAQTSSPSLGIHSSSAANPSASATPPACATVKSQLGWKGTICASFTQDIPANGGADTIHGVYGFNIFAGNIANISATGMYLRQCTSTGSCSSVQYTDGPSKNTSGEFAELVTGTQKMPPNGMDQARINTPCITWATQGQFACYNGVLETPWAES